jgi:hypothetical protein
MNSYISNYQQWGTPIGAEDTFITATILWDERYLIISDFNHSKYTVGIKNKIEEQIKDYPIEAGGKMIDTVYELEPNEQGYEKLIVGSIEYAQEINGYKFTKCFSLVNDAGTSHWFANQTQE